MDFPKLANYDGLKQTLGWNLAELRFEIYLPKNYYVFLSA